MGVGIGERLEASPLGETLNDPVGDVFGGVTDSSHLLKADISSTQTKKMAGSWQVHTW